MTHLLLFTGIFAQWQGKIWRSRNTVIGHPFTEMICQVKSPGMKKSSGKEWVNVGKLVKYKTIHGQSADYLKPLIEIYQPSRILRSASRSLLCPQKAKTENYGCRTFSFVAPKLWNSLPEDIKNAKTVICLKTSWKLIFLGKLSYFSKHYGELN